MNRWRANSSRPAVRQMTTGERVIFAKNVMDAFEVPMSEQELILESFTPHWRNWLRVEAARKAAR